MLSLPAWMLEGRTLVAADRTTDPLAQHIARRGSAPANHPDGTGKRRTVLAALAPQPNPWRRALQIAQGRPRARLRLVAAPQCDPPVQILAAESRRLSAHRPTIDGPGLFSYSLAPAFTPRFHAPKRLCEACWQQAPGTIITQPRLRGVCRKRSAISLAKASAPNISTGMDVAHPEGWPSGLRHRS
jgi:hypothetical protein